MRSFVRAGPMSARDPLRAAAAREDPELDLGKAEARLVARDAQVARERELEAAAEGEAFDGGDHRPRESTPSASKRATDGGGDAARRRAR